MQFIHILFCCFFFSLSLRGRVNSQIASEEIHQQKCCSRDKFVVCLFGIVREKCTHHRVQVNNRKKKNWAQKQQSSARPRKYRIKISWTLCWSNWFTRTMALNRLALIALLSVENWNGKEKNICCQVKPISIPKKEIYVFYALCVPWYVRDVFRVAHNVRLLKSINARTASVVQTHIHTQTQHGCGRKMREFYCCCFCFRICCADKTQTNLSNEQNSYHLHGISSQKNLLQCTRTNGQI